MSMLSPVYVLHPGDVKSAHDGQTHYVNFFQLMQLYGLRSYQCIDGRTLEQPGSTLPPHAVHLYPRKDGKYTLPGAAS